jgi:uncharacterized membrane protein
MTGCQKALLAGLVLAPAGSGVATADEPGWKDVNLRDGVQIAAKPWAGSAFHEMRATGDMDAPPERILAVIADFERYPDFMPTASQAQVLQRDGDRAYYYMEITPPVISRRDYCIRVTVERLESGSFRNSWAADDSACPPERKGVVRVHANQGEWLLSPIDGGRRTHVVYRCHIDVGGHVPGWMVNRASAKELPNIFAAVKRTLSQPRYAACTDGRCK